MLCNECNQNPAVMHYVTVINGQKKETDLCVSCAKKLGLASFSPFSFGDLFAHAAREAPPQVACSACGMTIAQMKKSGVVGCEQCYKDLYRGIEPILNSVQKTLQHVGRTPVGHASGNLPRPGETATPAQPREMSEEEKLKAELNRAVAEERFEEAAKIRDTLRAMQKEGKA